MLDVIEIILLAGIGWVLYTQKGDARGLSLFGLGKRRRLILDSCALIDGRVVEIVRSGFVAGELVIPQFILNELQLLADGHDSHKRERARYGLDVAHELQDTAPMSVVIDRTVFPNIPATDDKLVQLAKKLRAQLYTTDYNLSKVAAVEGVQVLNVNELSQSLRPITLPGETLQIKIIQKGSNRDQGVGYLDDGTMIVIEGGARFVGREMPVTVTRMHQTVAGKMVFGQVRDREGREHQRDQRRERSEQREQRTAAHTHSVPTAPEPAIGDAYIDSEDLIAISEQPRSTRPAAATRRPAKQSQHGRMPSQGQLPRRAPAAAPAQSQLATAKNKLHTRLNLRRRPTVSH